MVIVVARVIIRVRVKVRVQVGFRAKLRGRGELCAMFSVMDRVSVSARV